MTVEDISIGGDESGCFCENKFTYKLNFNSHWLIQWEKTQLLSHWKKVLLFCQCYSIKTWKQAQTIQTTDWFPPNHASSDSTFILRANYTKNIVAVVREAQIIVFLFSCTFYLIHRRHECRVQVHSRKGKRAVAINQKNWRILIYLYHFLLLSRMHHLYLGFLNSDKVTYSAALSLKKKKSEDKSFMPRFQVFQCLLFYTLF